MANLTERHLEAMGIPRRLHEANWQSMVEHGISAEFFPYLSKLKESESVTKEDFLRFMKNVFLAGEPYTGKSYAAAVLAKGFRKYGFSVQWLDAVEGYDLLSWSKEYRDPEYATWPIRCALVDVLVIDDMGSEKSGKRTKILYDLLKNRFENNRITIVTTRLNKKLFAEAYGDSADFVTEFFRCNLSKKIEKN